MLETTPAGSPIAIQPITLSQVESVIQRVDLLSERDLDDLPIGMIQLDANGKILRFNKTEAQLARLNRDNQLGKNFFSEVAPCTKVKEFHGRFVDGLQKKELFETFGFVFKFAHGPRHVAITLFYSAKTSSVWVLVSQANKL
jgi:photoactive yellow protein